MTEASRATRHSPALRLTRRAGFALGGRGALLAARVGAGLGIAGAALQPVTGNPLADPHRLGIPVACFCGAVFVARALIPGVVAPDDMPVGVVTGLVGGVFFIWLMVRKS